MSNRVEKLLDVPNYAPVIGVYDLGLKKGSFDSGFQSFEYRDFSIVGYPGEERQADPASIEDGRFSLTADGIAPNGLVRETHVGRWQLIARKLGYSNIPFQPKHHDNNGSSRTLSIGAEAIDTPDKAQQIAASLFGKFESDTPVEDFIVLGASAVSGFLQSFSESDRLREQRVMPYYQAGYYLVNADSDLRTLATMSYMSGLNEVACLLPDEHRYRVLVNTAWSIVSYIVASRSSIDHFDEQKGTSRQDYQPEVQ